MHHDCYDWDMGRQVNEFYELHRSGGRYTLPRTFRVTSGGFVPTRNLVRARGSTRVFDLSDGLPEPQLITLSGLWYADTETELHQQLRTCATAVATCVQLNRIRPAVGTTLRHVIYGMSVQGGSLVWAPIDFDSSEANVTITLVPEYIR